MIRRNTVLALALAPVLCSPAHAQQAIVLEPNEMFEWQPEHDGATFLWGGLTMTLDFVHPDPFETWIEAATLTVSGVSFRPFTLSVDAGFDGFGQIGIFEIDTQGRPSLVFGAYTGGAHCCMDLTTAWFGTDDMVIEHLGTFDGSTVFPEDYDGDGTYELPVRDYRFAYTFSSYAASFPPLLVLKTERGRRVDVTGDPAYRAAVGKQFEALAPYCGGDQGWLAGACAGWLANAAHLGIYAESRDQLAAHVDGGGQFEAGWDSFTFCQNENCTEEVTFTDLLDALDFALVEWGYRPAAR